MQPHLHWAEVSDEELMKVVNDLASKQAERKMKMAISASHQKNAKVNTSSTVPDKLELAKQKPKNESLASINEKLLAEIKEIKTDLSNLKEQVCENKTPSGYRQSPRFNQLRTQPHKDVCHVETKDEQILVIIALIVGHMAMSRLLAIDHTIPETRVGYS